MSETEISLPEAALMLKASYNQVWALVLRGVLHGQKRGARWVVCREDVEVLALQREEERAL